MVSMSFDFISHLMEAKAETLEMLFWVAEGYAFKVLTNTSTAIPK